MIVLPFRRKRLIFWLLRAYLRRWLKTLLFFFTFGIIITILSLKFLPGFLNFTGGVNTVGFVGSYIIEALPLEIQQKISLGLTRLEEDGSASPDLATSWEISSDGKVYTLHLREDVFFQDRAKLRASDVNYSFKEAKLSFLDEKTVQFTLNEPFSPFLTVVSQPIFKKGLIGVGEYKVKKTDLNGPFISSLILENLKTKEKLIYRFYPTEEAARTAFILGEVGTVRNLYNLGELGNWKNVKIQRTYVAREMVALFFNTRDPLFSQENIRQAFAFSLPDEFEEGKTASSPLSFKSFAYQERSERFIQNLTRAKELLGEAPFSAQPITLATDRRLENLAQKLAKNWDELGIKTNLEAISGVPTNFQVFLGIFRIPSDPDQYVLWHSTQATNITGFTNQKIDKLLEDGRKTQDRTEREKIYADFQKYLVDDAPAVFLYYPTVYTIKRK